MARVAAAPLGIAIGVTVSACFIKPGEPGGNDPDASVSGDGLLTTDGRPPCPVRDDFSGTSLPLCGTWGEREGSGSGNQNFYRSATGQLVMSSSGSGGSGACQGSQDIPFTAVGVQILKAPTLYGAGAGMQLRFGDGTTFAVEVRGTGGASMLVAIYNSGTEVQVGGFDSSMINFRLAKNGATNISLLVSDSSGMASITNSYIVSSVLSTARVRLYTNFGSNSSYTLAEFDNLDGCAL